MREVDAIQSRIEQVIVFASGARVRRVAVMRAPAPSRMRLVGLPLSVIDDTVRAEVTGPAVVTALRTGVTVPSGDAAPEELPELRAARMRQDIAQAEVERLDRSIDRLAHAKVIVDDPSDEPPPAWNAVLGARKTLVAIKAERELALRQQLVTARRELDDARRAFEVAAERDVRSGTSRAARAHEVRKHVELDLSEAGAGGEITIHIEYQVAAARWAPSYVARLDGDQARFELRAVVAQNTGEDWDAVALRLSTAEPDQFAPLPELQPQKIGRRQAEPAKRGFRAPPAGAEVLYADYDVGFPKRERVLTGGYSAPEAPPADVNWDEESSRAKDAYQQQAVPPPRGVASPAPEMMRMAPAAPPMSRSKSGGIASTIVGGLAGAVATPFALAAQGLAKKESNLALGGGGGSREQQASTPASVTPRLDYGALVMAAPSSPQRGTLVPAPRSVDVTVAQGVAEKTAAVSRLPLPPGHVAEWAHTYDYAFASDGSVDVKSDGAWHSLGLTSRAGSAKIHHVAVPREQADVFRVAHVTNPFDGPLLPGPIDVYDRGQFLVTSSVDYTPPGGGVDVGLGVDANVKIARNAEFHEEAAGMLRGALKLVHAITIEVENLSPRALDLEVRERVPIVREGDDDVEVTIGKVEPAWDRWSPETDGPHDATLRGGQSWRVEVAPRAKKLLRAAYEVKIASKHELVGGNRREP